MRRLAQTGMAALPVVSRTNVRELKGSVSLADILDAYGIRQARETRRAAPADETRLPKKLIAGARRGVDRGDAAGWIPELLSPSAARATR